MAQPIRSLQLLSLMLGGSVLLTGCSLSPTASTANESVAGAALHGVLFGGQQPVVGAALQLYAAGTGGYGSAAAALLPGGIVTGANGAFNISAQYTCPTATTPVYLVATGGNPGLGTGTNANLAAMVALGGCGALVTSTSTIVMNELTTVASAWALAPFAGTYTNIGAPVSNAAGLLTAFAAVPKLVDIPNGAVPGTALPAGATEPVAEMNTLADIFAACFNSAGGVAKDGSGCGTLFDAATPPGGTAPTNTLDAALNMARNPGVNVGKAFGLVTATSPFQNPLSTAPTDWTISITYTAGGFKAPKAAAIDAAGNVWVANSGNNTLTVLTPSGAPSGISPLSGNGLNIPSAIALDPSGNAWVANKGGSSLSGFTAAGGVFTGSPFTGGALSAPVGIAVDGAGIVWAANSGANTVTQLNPASPSSSTSFSAGGIHAPAGLAVSPQ